jgi:hypothetical protein
MRTEHAQIRPTPRGFAEPHPHWAAADHAGMTWSPGTVGTLLIAVVVTATPVFLHLLGPPIGVAVCVVLALLLANFAAPAVPITVLFSSLFQNTFVSLASPAITSVEQLNTIRSYSFVLTATAWLAIGASYWMTRAAFSRELRTLMDLTTAALVIISLYFLLGVRENPSGAVVYLRNIVTPIFLFQIFAVTAYRHRLAITTPLLVMACVTLAYGFLEFLVHDSLINLINGDTYLEWRMHQDHEPNAWMKELHDTGRVIRSHFDTLLIDFLNTPLLAGLGLRFYRILGPNFHFISYAYALAFFSIVLLALGRSWFILLALPLLLVVGSKGALILTILVAVGVTVLPHLRGFAPLQIYGAILGVYIIAALVTGMAAQDYHIIGFIGGLKGFVANPIGRGIGVGGNLSLDMTTIDWSKSQYLGHTDVAVESAVGVLLYQMGVFGVVLTAGYVWLAWKLWACHLHFGGRLYAAGCFAILTVIANGIFQEEAMFAPLALGIVTGFAGLLLGRASRVPAPVSRSGSKPSIRIANPRAVPIHHD